MLKPRAARVAARLTNELGIETKIQPGGFGEFTVLLDDKVVLKRTSLTVPQDEVVIDAVRSHLNGG